MKNFKLAAMASVAALACTQPALAGTSDTSLSVSAIVLDNCTIVALPLAFGAIADAGAADVDSTATLTLACTPNASYQVGLDDGENATGSQRRMANADSTEFLEYEIYSDTARTTRWGNTLDSDTVAGTANAVGVGTLTAYGRIESDAPAVSAGTYTDTVTVTVNF